MRRARLVAAMLLAITFVSGGLAGMALEEGLGLDWFDFLDEDVRRDQRLVDGLQLTGSQRASVQRILDGQERRLEAYWSARLPEMQAIVDRSHEEIRALLTPEQRAVFDQRVRARAAGPVEAPGD